MAAVPRSFPKTARILRRREFLELQHRGRRRHTPHFVLIHRENRSGLNRLGVTVSTRVGNSVIRNRVKRRLREVFRERRSTLVPAADLVIIAKPGAGTLSYAEVADELAPALDTATGV